MVKLNDNRQASNVVNRLFGTEMVDMSFLSENDIREGKKTIFEIPLEMIQARAINNYSLTGINELAESIERTGLWQPIIVRKNNAEGREYIIVSGERRYTAVKLLHDKYEKLGDYTKSDLFSTIAAVVMDESELDKEQDVYRDTNDYSRQLTNFERIIRLEPDMIDMQKESWQEKFIERCYGAEKVEAWKAGKFKVKGNLAEKCKYIVSLLIEKEPDLDISEKTVRNYLTFLARCTDNLKIAVLKGKIPLREAREAISWLAPTEQTLAVEAATSQNNEEYQKYLEQGKSVAGGAVKVTETNPDEQVAKIYSGIAKSLIKSKNDFEKVADKMSGRTDLNRNQKEYLKQMKEVIKSIKVLESMPKE